MTPLRTMKTPAERFPDEAPVEVMCEEEGFKGSWFEAKVISSTTRHYHVLYSSLRESPSDDSPLHRELVKHRHVRPRPPRLRPEGGFLVAARVDAFHNDGWWDGLVTKTEHRADVRYYTVYFPFSNEEIEFEEKYVRVHLEWFRGQWLQPKAAGIELPKFHELGLNDLKKKIIKRKRSARKWLRNLSVSIEESTSGDGPRLHGGMATLPVDVPDSEKGYKSDYNQSPSQGIYPEIRVLATSLEVTPETPGSVAISNPKQDDKCFPSRKRLKKMVAKRAKHRSVDPTQMSNGTFQQLSKKRRGRPRKTSPDDVPVNGQNHFKELVDEPINERNEDNSNGSSISMDCSVVTPEVQLTTAIRGGMSEQTVGSAHVLTCAGHHLNMGEASAMAPEPGRSCVSNGVIDVEKSTDAFVHVTNMNFIADEVVRDEVRTESPFSNVSTLDLVSKGVQKQANDFDSQANGMKVGTDRQSFANANIDPISLPFVKKSSLWESFESNRLFSGMNQRLHFLPLSQLHEDLREGTAIGLMINFANFVESLTMLKMDDPITTYNGKINTLSVFDDLGFDIAPLREFLERLLKLKRDMESLQDEHALENQMKESDEEISKLTEEIDAITSEKRELEKLLAIVLERLDSKRCLYEKAKSNAAAIQEEMQKLKDESRLVVGCFYTAIASFRSSVGV